MSPFFPGSSEPQTLLGQLLQVVMHLINAEGEATTSLSVRSWLEVSGMTYAAYAALTWPVNFVIRR